MSFLDLARARISVRSYREDPVEERKLKTVLEAGRLAPSAANKQPWTIVVVKDESQRKALGQAYTKEWFWRAPVVLVLCVKPAEAWTRGDGKNYADVDGAICMDHMTLCAAELGLGTCWLGAFNPDRVREALGLPADVEPLAMTPLGTPVNNDSVKRRKTMEEIVRYDRW